jgi:hypothetical protein
MMEPMEERRATPRPPEGSTDQVVSFVRDLIERGEVRPGDRHGSGTYFQDGPPVLGFEPLGFLAALHASEHLVQAYQYQAQNPTARNARWRSS